MSRAALARFFIGKQLKSFKFYLKVSENHENSGMIFCKPGQIPGLSRQEYIERREYRTRLCSALNVCGESRAWNANHVRLLARGRLYTITIRSDN